MRGTSKINFNAFTAVCQILQCFEKRITLNNQVVKISRYSLGSRGMEDNKTTLFKVIKPVAILTIRGGMATMAVELTSSMLVP